MKIQDLGMLTLGCEKLSTTTGVMSEVTLGFEDKEEAKEVAAHIRKIMDATEDLIKYLTEKAKPYNDGFRHEDQGRGL